MISVTTALMSEDRYYARRTLESGSNFDPHLRHPLHRTLLFVTRLARLSLTASCMKIVANIGSVISRAIPRFLLLRFGTSAYAACYFDECPAIFEVWVLLCSFRNG